ncbi:hypothetical protein [Enhygromyxa salina]|nr:hypothetical protein [Enhygromyxa salina]
MPPDRVWFVDGDEPNCDDDGSGTEDTPLCSLLGGLGRIGANEKGTLVLRDMPGQTYEESLTVQSGRTVAIVGEGLEYPVWSNGVENFALQINGASLYLSDVEIESADAYGVELLQGKAWIQRAKIVNNTGGGVAAAAGTLVIENSFIGGSLSDVNAIENNGADLLLSYSTVVAGAAGFGMPAALACTDGTTTVRGSVLVSVAMNDEVACQGAMISGSVLENDAGFPGNTGLQFEMDWFVDLLKGDFHLDVAPDGIENAAVWASGDPRRDIDGEPRQDQEGEAGYAGADVPL